MSNISDKFDRTVKVERLEPANVEGQEEYAESIAELDCLIQPLEDSFTEDIEGNFGKDSVLFCEFADILEGDRIVDDGSGKSYKVVGVEKFDFEGDEHMEIKIREFNG